MGSVLLNNIKNGIYFPYIHYRGIFMSKSDYWKENLRLVAILLSIWFAVSFLFGIILVDTLNIIRVGGVGLGFWFAQQGSIYTFLALIFVYTKKMNALDRKYDVHEDKEET